MDINETPQFVVFEKPALKDQVISGAVGAVATVVATAVVGVGATLIQNAITTRHLRKLAKAETETTTED